MLAKNIFGILILLFNFIGLGYLLYRGALARRVKTAFKEKTKQDLISSEKKRTSLIVQDNIVPDEDDLLKDMDLSDLDHLNLDDFE